MANIMRLIRDGGTETKTIGIVAPNKGRIHEEEYPDICPEYNYMISPLGIKSVTPEQIDEIFGDYIGTAEWLSQAGADVLLASGTPLFAVKGVGSDKEMIEKIEKITDTPTTVMTASIVNALDVLDLNDICVVTPYTDQIDQYLHEFLEQSEINVIEIRNLGLETSDPDEYNKQGPEVSYRLAKSCIEDNPSADGCFISCAGFRTLDNIHQLEEETGKPVISSSQASLWKCLQLLDHSTPVNGYGKLLEDHL